MSSMLSPSDEVMRRMRDRYQRIRTIGGSQAAVLTHLDINNLPDWIDHDRLLQAQATARQYHLSLSFAHVSGLLFVLQIPSGFLPLIATGKSESLPALFLRYLSTINHVNEWSESDLLDPDSKAYKSIAHVRCLHKSIFERMKRSGIEPVYDGVWVSQHSMVVTQFAFVGLMFMHPRAVGVGGTDEHVHRVLSDIAYLWRCVGWMQGIVDEHNMCSGSLEETIALSHVLFENSYKPVMEAVVHPNPKGYEMGQDVMRALSSLIPGVTGKVVMTFWARTLNLCMPYIGPLSWREWFFYYGICFEHAFLYDSWFRAWHTSRIRIRLDRVNANKQSEYEKLCKLDPSPKYSAEAVAMSPCGFPMPPNLVQGFANSTGGNKIAESNNNSDSMIVRECKASDSKRSIHPDG